MSNRQALLTPQSNLFDRTDSVRFRQRKAGHSKCRPASVAPSQAGPELSVGTGSLPTVSACAKQTIIAIPMLTSLRAMIWWLP